jgi:bacteriocin biosynthesis cyclodehydratase domain-containing protein
MTGAHSSKKLRALPVQLIPIKDGVILKRGCTEVKFVGEGAGDTLRFLLAAAAGDGVTREELGALFPETSRPAIATLIERLVGSRFLVPADSVMSPVDGRESSLDIFYWHFGDTTARVTERLNSQRIVILGVNEISRQLVTSLGALGANNFEVVDDPLLRNLRLFDDAGQLIAGRWPVSELPQTFEEWVKRVAPQSLGCLVATSDFGDRQMMKEWNRFCVDNRRLFLPVVLRNVTGYVGPLVVPGETACFECLEARQNSHMNDHATARTVQDGAFEGQVATGFHPSMASILGDIAAFELTKFYSGALPMRNVGTLIEVNLFAPQVTGRKVLKIPRCVVCSPLNARSSTTFFKTTVAQAEPHE